MNSEPKSQIGARVASIGETTAELQLEGHTQNICWPLKALPENINAGDKITIEFKHNPAASIHKMIDAAKKQPETGNPIIMKELLEKLIN